MAYQTSKRRVGGRFQSPLPSVNRSPSEEAGIPVEEINFGAQVNSVRQLNGFRRSPSVQPEGPLPLMQSKQEIINNLKQ